MNVQNPLAFMESYKAVKARLNARMTAKEPPKVVYISDDPCGPRRVARDILLVATPGEKRPMFATLKVQVAQEFGVSTLDLDSSRRTAHICKARHRLWWLGRKYTALSLPQMGRLTGGRDHTTVLHGIRRYEEIELGLPYDRAAAQALRYERTKLINARNGKFRSEVRIAGKRVNLGYFSSREEAAEARMAYRLQQMGAGA